MIDTLNMYDIDYLHFLRVGSSIGITIGFTVVFISLGIKYSLKLFAKS